MKSNENESILFLDGMRRKIVKLFLVMDKYFELDLFAKVEKTKPEKDFKTNFLRILY